MHPIGRRRALQAVGSALLLGIAGCSTQGTVEDPSERGPLSIDEFGFAASEPTAYGEYEAQPNATYSPGATVYCYVSLDGLAARPIEEGVQIDLEQRLVITAPTGETWVDETETHDTVLGAEHLERFYTKTPIPLSEDTHTGEYDLTITFTDHVSETAAEASGPFVVAD